MALAHRLFFYFLAPPFDFGRGHRKSNAPKWQQFKKLYGFFFALVLHNFFSSWKRRFFLSVVENAWAAKLVRPYKETKGKLLQRNRLYYSVCSCAGPSFTFKASKHFNTFVAFPCHHFDFIMWHFRLLRILFADALCGFVVVVCLDACSVAFISYQSKNHWNGNLLSATIAFMFDVSQLESCLCDDDAPIYMPIHFYDKHFGLFLPNVLIFQVVNVSWMR